jgi:hypothetical protein
VRYTFNRTLVNSGNFSNFTDTLACTGEKRNAYKVLVRNPAGKRPLRRLWADGRIIQIGS